MTAPVLQSAFLKQFSCLGADCPDTCCKGWGMQLDAPTRDKYEREAPELLEAVDTGEAEFIMRRDPATDYCVKFDNGLCGIHKQYGTDFLGDACHFYPRVTRRLGEKTLMGAVMSCPEVTRLMLQGAAMFAHEAGESDRLPNTLKNYLPAALDADTALTIHRLFLSFVSDEEKNPSRMMSAIASVARSLQAFPTSQWSEAVGFYLNTAESRLPAPEAAAVDPFNLLHAMTGLIAASKKTPRPRLDEVMGIMTDTLRVRIDADTLAIQATNHSVEAYRQAQARWVNDYAASHDYILRTWLRAQVALSLFPFAGLGETLADRVTVMGFRFALVRLALICACVKYQGSVPEAMAVQILQSLSRFLDHLADPTLTLTICQETGWNRESRMRALIGDL